MTRSSTRTLHWLSAVALLCLSQAALAAESSMISMDDFGDMITALKAVARSMSPFLVGEGVGLLGILFPIGLFLLVINLTFGPADPGVKANLLVHCFKGVVVAAMLASWVNYGTGSNQERVVPVGQAAASVSQFALPVSVEDMVVTPFDSLVNALFDRYAGGGGKEKLFNVVAASWMKMWEASDMRQEMRERIVQKLGPIDYLAWWVHSIGDRVLTFLVAAVVGLFALALILVYLFVIFFGDIIAYLGMFLGPIMIPGMLFSPLKFLFESWLKFMLSAGFFKLIAAWLTITTMKTVEFAQEVANRMYQKMLDSPDLASAAGNSTLMAGGLILSAIMTVIYMGFGILLMRQVWLVTGAVMSGSAGMGVRASQDAIARR